MGSGGLRLRASRVAFVVAALVLAFGASQAGAEDEGPLTFDYRDGRLDWLPCPPILPAGCEVAVLRGDPSSGPSEVFLRFPASYVIPPHWHSSAERMVVVAGKIDLTYEGRRPLALRPGDYVYGPAKLPHWGRCGRGGTCVLYIAFDAPVDAHLSDEP